MTNDEMLDTLKELMTAYNTARAAWIARFGDDIGFDEWFTKHVKGQNVR